MSEKFFGLPGPGLQAPGDRGEQREGRLLPGSHAGGPKSSPGAGGNLAGGAVARRLFLFFGWLVGGVGKETEKGGRFLPMASEHVGATLSKDHSYLSFPY